MTPTQIRIPWPNWEIVRPLGGGSFGKVYEIQRQILGGGTEKAAMKIICVPADPSEAQELLSCGYDRDSINQRFRQDLEDIAREYALMAELKGNVNVVYCDDLFYQSNPDGLGWELYIKMELLSPLAQVLGNPPRDEQVIKLGMDICSALSACKKKNIIHRDIKPANIMVSADGHYKLGDFGIAKTAERTTGGTKTGTYSYMAPEVYNNQPYGAAVDIYSLGMVLYWILNGRCGPFLPPPPTVPSATQVDHAKQRRFGGEALPAPAYGSKGLKKAVLKACAFDPRARFSSPEEMSDALANLLTSDYSFYRAEGDSSFTEEDSTIVGASESDSLPPDLKSAIAALKNLKLPKITLPTLWPQGISVTRGIRGILSLFVDLFGVIGFPYFILSPIFTILSDAFGTVFTLISILAYFPAVYLTWRILKERKKRFLVILIRGAGYVSFFSALLIALIVLYSLLSALGTISGNL